MSDAAVDELAHMFDRAQHSVAQQSAALRRVQALLAAASPSGRLILTQHLCAHVSRVLLVGRQEPAVERLVIFIAKFIGSAESDVQRALVQLLVQHVDAQERTVRWRACQLLGASVAQLASAPSLLPRALARLIRVALASRLVDRVVQVRVHAAGALATLWSVFGTPTKEVESQSQRQSHAQSQGDAFLDVDEDEEDVDVTALLASALECDEASEVRVAVLRALSAPFLHAPPPSSSEHLLLQALLVRVRDVDANVRVAAVDAVTRLVRVEALTVTQRVRVLDAVLLDDAAAVRGKSAALLHAWLRDVRDDVFALLRALEPTVHEATAERVSAALAALVPLDPTPFQDGELDAVMALHWRVLAAHVAAHSGVSERERIFESLLPELPKLGMLLSVAAVARDAPFLMRQLLALVMCVDVADESGRRQLQGALLRLMPQWRDESVLTAFVRALRHVTPDEDEFIREVIGVVSELRDPLEPEFDADADDGAQSQSQSDAPWSPRAHVRTMLREREAASAIPDSQAEARWPPMLCLTALLLGEFLGARVNPCEDPALSNLLDAVILPAVRHTSPTLRAPALRCLGLFVLRDAGLAVQFAPLLLQAVDKDVLAVRVEALHAVCNLLCVHGLAHFGDSEHAALDTAADSPRAQQSLLRAVLRCASRADEALRAAAVEGLCKLYAQQVLSDVRVLAKLIVDYNHPLTAPFTRMRAVLRAFFTFVGSVLTAARGSSRASSPPPLLERAYLAAVTQILASDAQSFTARIDLVALSAPLLPLLAAASPWSQRRIALALCRLIDRSPLGAAGTRLPALLPLLTFERDARVDGAHAEERDSETAELQPSARVLRLHVLRCLRDVHDKSARTHLERVLKALSAVDASGAISDAEVAALRVRAHREYSASAPARTATAPTRTARRRTPSTLQTEGRHTAKRPRYEAPDQSHESEADVGDEEEEEEEALPMDASAPVLRSDEIFAQSQEHEIGDTAAQLQRQDSGLREVTSILSTLKRQLRDTSRANEEDAEERAEAVSAQNLIAELEKKLARLMGEQTRQRHAAQRRDRSSPVKPPAPPRHVPPSAPTPPRTPAAAADTVPRHTPAPSRASIRRGERTTPSTPRKLAASNQEGEEDVFSFARAFHTPTPKKPKSAATPTPRTSRKRLRDDAEDVSDAPPTSPQTHDSGASSASTSSTSDKEAREPRPSKRARREPAAPAPARNTPRVVRSAKAHESVLFPHRTAPRRRSAAAAETKSPPRVVIAFTGFGKPEHPCTLEQQTALATACARVFGAESVFEGEQLAAHVTHVVAPLDVRTLKTFAALLSGRWLMSPGWLEESLARGRFVSEDGRGIRGSTHVFKGRRIFFTPDFVLEVERRNVSRDALDALLLQMGRAQTALTVNEANLVLVAAREQDSFKSHPERDVWTWRQLLEHVQPPQPPSNHKEHGRR